MNWVDAAILTTVVASTLTGAFWGLIRQVVSIVGLVGGIYLAGRFYEQVARGLHGEHGGGLVADPNWARIIAFGGIVIVFSLAVGIAGSALRLAVRLLFLGWADHLLGALLGFVSALMLIMPLLVVATVFPVPNVSRAVKASQVAQMLNTFVPAVITLLPPEFASLNHEL